jgi:hypothetical protein
MLDKQTLRPAALSALVDQQLRSVPAIRAALEQDPSFAVLIGTARAHERDARGRNWNIDAFRTGFGHWPQCHHDFRLIVDGLRLRFDLGEPGMPS